ncbi:hypothetical protein BX257_8333 [Streptomyces sp. 3212.3]|nr:hypothetical protein BX257_8333 [Streptomyces sp. 3212.3]
MKPRNWVVAAGILLFLARSARAPGGRCRGRRRAGAPGHHTATVLLRDYGYSFSPFASIATYFSIRRARVSAFLASWTRYRIA